LILFCMSVATAHSESAPSAVDATTLHDKVIVGYQGWFSCPDDHTGPKNWGHWINADGSPAVDMVPDTSEFPQQPGCRAPFIRDREGNPVMLFSSQNPETVDVQFRWLQQYGVSGVALQRFVSELSDPQLKSARDQVLANVRKSAELHARVFFVTYDISGAGPEWPKQIEQDWQALVAAHITDSPAYLHNNGLPVVEIWGIGWNDRPSTPAQAIGVLKFWTASADSKVRASVMAGVPVAWRSLSAAKPDDVSWADVYRLASAISPWFVGAVGSAAHEKALIDKIIRGDVELTREQNQVYMPVIFPGFSTANQSHGRSKFEVQPRECGAYLKLQIDALRNLGLDSFYVAMFDEANEGTAVFKTRMTGLQTKPFPFLQAYSGCAASSDLYLKMLGALAATITREIGKR
jgi:hypothetical protein